MAKRSIERLECIPGKTSLSEGTLRRPKRQRTEGFVETAANHQQKLSVCQFFEAHLKKSAIAEVNRSPGIPSMPSSEEILHALRRSTAECCERHNAYCSGLLRETNDMIRIYESFRHLSAGIDGSSAILGMLDKGIETTEFIKSIVSSYAGVPREMELRDMKRLHSILR